MAALADDGRYHLVVDGWLVCRSRRRAGRRRVRVVDGRVQERAGVFPHELVYRWWTDGVTYRVHPPPSFEPVGGERCERFVEWSVGLTGPLEAPELVRGRRRCAATTSYPLLWWWPPYLGPETPKGRLRARLVDELGEACHACGGARGVFIDHLDAPGRLVRGLLCRHCNSQVDGCMHLSGCVWASYLDDPPARHLGLRYPR